MDKTVVLWKPDPVSGVWMEEVNFYPIRQIFVL